MLMIHGHLLQGMPLCFAQLDGAFHLTAFELDSLFKRTNFKTVYPEHLSENDLTLQRLAGDLISLFN
ncbi:hypothetical protein [Paraburkholderia solitsugae]|uniref:hypothetical protein n=1 Tax=Paraburkholderia solitsugae TaxID=2675748 RepID=UPI0015530B78|nr:hypothetical protein [Paraburkholderia solitsugae]